MAYARMFGGLLVFTLIFAVSSGCGGTSSGDDDGGGATEDTAASYTEPSISGTAVCIGLRWLIAEDANQNAAVTPWYRVSGSGTWLPAMALLRVQRAHQHITLQPPANVTLFAGSIFNLQPDTDYDVRLDLDDPDGGSTSRTLAVTTWTEPLAPAPARTLYVQPGSGGGTGSSGDPFLGLAAANAAALPGDCIIVRNGTYYGSFEITTSGTEGSPIVWIADGGATPVLNANGGNPVVRIEDRHDVIVEGLTLRNADWGVILRRCQRVTFRGLDIYDVHYGIDASVNASNYKIWISDCTLAGSNTWPRGTGQSDWRGIKVSGQIIAVCHNRIHGFYDGVDTSDFHPTRDVDMYLNDISECVDDGIELDFSDDNTRAFENRLTNCFQVISFQPVYGGPAYAVRNAMYNYEGDVFKLHNVTSGCILLHNTAVKDYDIPMLTYNSGAPVHNLLAYNNLFVARDADYAHVISAVGSPVIFDYNVYAGGPYLKFGKWVDTRYDTLPDFTAGTGQEAHGVDSPGFAGIFTSGSTPPTNVNTQYSTAVNDLRPSASSPVIDAGDVLPSVNDGYAGSAPDAGCLEYGASLPAYGPR